MSEQPWSAGSIRWYSFVILLTFSQAEFIVTMSTITRTSKFNFRGSNVGYAFQDVPEKKTQEFVKW